MYEYPGSNIKTVIITEDTIRKNSPAEYIREPEHATEQDSEVYEEEDIKMPQEHYSWDCYMSFTKYFRETD